MDTKPALEDWRSNTTTAQVLSGFEALLFVLVGVFASRLPVMALVPVMFAIVVALLLIRWLTSAPARMREAASFVRRRYELRGLLLEDLQEIVAYIGEERWTYHELVWAVDFWFYDTLIPDHLADNPQPQKSARSARAARKRARVSRRPRLSAARSRLQRGLEATMTKQPALMDAAFRAGSREVARILLERALAEKFVSEHLEHSPTRAEITYSLDLETLESLPDGA